MLPIVEPDNLVNFLLEIHRPHPEPLHSSHQENMHIAGAGCATIQIQSKIRELMHEISTVDLVSGVMNIINYKDGAC